MPATTTKPRRFAAPPLPEPRRPAATWLQVGDYAITELPDGSLWMSDRTTSEGMQFSREKFATVLREFWAKEF